MQSMRDAVSTQTTQIGIVVRDLDVTVQNYGDLYGIGPWTFRGMIRDVRDRRPATNSAPDPRQDG
jgi:hypothetical protein